MADYAALPRKRCGNYVFPARMNVEATISWIPDHIRSLTLLSLVVRQTPHSSRCSMNRCVMNVWALTASKHWPNPSVVSKPRGSNTTRAGLTCLLAISNRSNMLCEQILGWTRNVQARSETNTWHRQVMQSSSNLLALTLRLDSTRAG